MSVCYHYPGSHLLIESSQRVIKYGTPCCDETLLKRTLLINLEPVQIIS